MALRHAARHRSTIIRALAGPLTALGLSACGYNGATGGDFPGARLSVDPREIDFGEVPLGVVHQTTVKITNQRRRAVTITSIALEAASPDVALADVLTNTCSGMPLPASSSMTFFGGACATVGVRYGPHALVSTDDKVVILSNDPNTPRLEIPLSGSGVPTIVRACFVTGSGASAVVDPSTCLPLTMPTPTLDFGAEPTNQRTNRVVRVFNDGKSSLTISDQHVDSMAGAFWLLDGPLAQVIPPGAYVDLTVQLFSRSAVVETGDLIIPSGGPAFSTFTIPLTGTVTAQ